MARFERQEEADHRLTDTVGAATEQLRAALEREAIEILRKAQEEAESIREAAGREAASIEDAARGRAVEVEQQALRRAEEAIAHAAAADARAEEQNAKADEESARAEAARASHADRITRALADVDAMDERLQAAVADLRRRLSGELDRIQPSTPPSPSEMEVSTTRAEDGHSSPPSSDVALEQIAPADESSPSSIAEAEEASEQNPQLEPMMRAQLQSMRDSGRTRDEAERFLARFRSGASYVTLLDEFFPPQEEPVAAPSAKRRRFGRRG